MPDTPASLSDSETSTQRYGLPDERDPETGELTPVEHTYEWGDEDTEITIVIRPPTATEVERWQDIGAEMSVGEMENIVSTHLVEPTYETYSMRELQCYIEGIADYVLGDSDEFEAAVDERLDDRGGDTPGNRSTTPSSSTPSG